MNKAAIKLFYTATLFACVFICGCATYSDDLGFSNSEWQSFDQNQQTAYLNSYKKINTEYENLQKQQKKPPATPTLIVKVYAGQVMMPPFNDYSNYKPGSFVISRGECKEVELDATEGSGKVMLRSCFKGNTLYVDQSHYDLAKRLGSITITSSPLWLQGFAYQGISTSGYARLKNATIEIKERAHHVKQAAVVTPASITVAPIANTGLSNTTSNTTNSQIFI